MTADQRPGMYQGSERLQGLPPGLPIYEIVNIRDALADNHRPLYELRASLEAFPEAMQHGAYFRGAHSIYPGSRHDKWMNTDALKAMTTHEQAIQDGLGWIHAMYGTNRQESSIPVGEALVLTNIANTLPYFLINKGGNSFPRNAVPALVADIFKAARGIADPLKWLLAEDPKSTITTEKLYDEAESRGLFVTEDGWSCPEPKPMIISAANALFFGKGAYPKRSKLHKYVDSPQQLQDFNALLMGFELRALVFQNESITQRPSGEAGFVEYVNQAQRAMNVVLGRDPSSVPNFTLADMAKLDRPSVTDTNRGFKH